MEQYKSRRFQGEDIRVTFEDIEACNNMSILTDWKFKILSKITEIKNYLNYLSTIISNEEFAEVTIRYKKAHGYKRVLGFLLGKVEEKLRVLKKDEAQKRKIHHDQAFVEAAKEILSKEAFMQIINRSKELLRDLGKNEKQ